MNILRFHLVTLHVSVVMVELGSPSFINITVFSNFPKIYWIEESFSKHGYEELTFFKARFNSSVSIKTNP